MTGVAAPYYGAWAEGFRDTGYPAVCGVKLGLTQVGNQDGWLMDIYVWNSSGGNPNNVMGVTTGINPGAIAMWPTIGQHDIDITDCESDTADYFVGWWPTWINAGNGWYVAADENGFGVGLPRTNIAPGIGLPTGWNHPNVVTGAGCQDLGIAVYEYAGIGPVPVRNNTWGALKALYD